MKHLSYYLDYVNDATKVSKYSGFINAQGSGIVHYATGAGYMVGSVWYAADAGEYLLSWGFRRRLVGTKVTLLVLYAQVALSVRRKLKQVVLLG